MAQCTAKSKRTGERCKAHAVDGYTVCRMHGAGSPHKGRPGGGDGRPITTGRYSLAHRKSLEEKAQAFVNDLQPGNLTGELALMRALLQDYLERFPDGQRLPYEDIARMFEMAAEISRLVERIAKIIAATSLTQSDIKHLQERFTLALLTYIPDADTRIAILRFIFEDSGAVIPGDGARFIEG